MIRKLLAIGPVFSLMIALNSNVLAAANNLSGEPSLSLLAAGLEGASGSTVGPDGAPYLTEGARFFFWNIVVVLTWQL